MSYEKFEIKPIPENPETESIRGRFTELNRMVSEACNKLFQAGYEPFIETVYGDDGLPKEFIVRPRRPEDKD
jgi:hypothetical protein